MLRDYCTEHFVSRGMCADFAIHIKDDHNPHAHILEICMDTGFQSVSSFNRNFKALSGETPEGYRAIHK